MKNIIIAILFAVLGMLLVWVVFEPKIAPYYVQLTKTRVGLSVDLQPEAQKEAHFVGSKRCGKCHEENYREWKHSMHSKMIQEIKYISQCIEKNLLKLLN